MMKSSHSMSSATNYSQPPAENDARRFVDLPGPYHMYRGGTLPGARIAYEAWGELAATRDNVILLFTGLSPDAHAASSNEDPRPGWWEFMIGPGRPLNTDRFYVVCVNSLGSCFGSTGPSSINPDTGEAYRLDFPELSVEDIAATARLALRELGIDRVHTVVGASLGGMAALVYAADYPDEVANVATISAAAHATPFAIAIRSLQRDIITSDPEWRGGYYTQEPVRGMRLARKLGLTSYRSAEEWLQRFGRTRASERSDDEKFGVEFQVEAYLDWNARKFVGTFDANSYLYLSRAMDLYDLAEHGDGGSLQAALARMAAKRHLVLGVQSDFLFPVWQQEELASSLKQVGHEVTFEVLSSRQGHDSFLVDKDRFVPVVGEFLAAT